MSVCTVTLGAGIHDTAGHPLGGKTNWSFTTADGKWSASDLPALPPARSTSGSGWR
jgi:hypothetical protein